MKFSFSTCIVICGRRRHTLAFPPRLTQALHKSGTHSHAPHAPLAWARIIFGRIVPAPAHTHTSTAREPAPCCGNICVRACACLAGQSTRRYVCARDLFLKFIAFDAECQHWAQGLRLRMSAGVYLRCRAQIARCSDDHKRRESILWGAICRTHWYYNNT